MRGLSQGFEASSPSASTASTSRPALARLAQNQGRGSAEFVIGGYTRGQGARERLGALLLGFWKASRCATPDTSAPAQRRSHRALLQRAAETQTPHSPFADPPPLQSAHALAETATRAEVTSASGRRAARCGLRYSYAARGHRTRSVASPPATPRRGPRRWRRLPVGPAPAAPAPVTNTAASEAAAVLQQLDNPANRMDLAVGGARIKLTNLDRVYWPPNRARGSRHN